MGQLEWLNALSDLTAKGAPCVLVTVTAAKGSTPRDAGTKMIVTADAQFGTIGGGNLEYQAADEARKLLSSATADVTMNHYALGPKLAQCCGGAVTIMLEPFLAHTKTLYLFGAGHVGREVTAVLGTLPVNIQWIDERDTEFPRDLPRNCTKITNPNDVIFKDDAYIVVMTHSHELDYEIVKKALTHGKFTYLGLIGSDTKSVKFKKRLSAEGLAIENLTCPIGIEGINGKHPREIAIALAAELLQLGLTGAAASIAKDNSDCVGRDCSTCDAA